MIGTTVVYYNILEKLGEGETTTLQKAKLRRSDPVRRNTMHFDLEVI